MASLLFAVADWCLSLLFRAGSKPPNALDGNGFQPSQKTHSPCTCENLPANSESRDTIAQHSRQRPWSGETCCGRRTRISKRNTICSRAGGLVFFSRASPPGHAAPGAAWPRLPTGAHHQVFIA